MLCHLGCSFCLRVCVLIVDVWNRGPLCLKVHSSSFSYVAQGCMPKSKELLFLCRNVGTGQRSALLYSLCLSSHLSPSLFFFFLLFSGIFTLFSSFCLNRLSFNTLFAYTPPPLLPHHAVPLTPTFLLFFSNFLVSACYLNSCIFFSHISQFNILSSTLPLCFFSPCPLLLLPPATQCSCRRTRPTRCCDGCAGPTSCWRRWSRVTSSGSAARRSAPMRRPVRLLRTMRRRWGDDRQITSHLQFFMSSRLNTHRKKKETSATHIVYGYMWPPT